MKSYKLTILGFGLMLLIASCKKEDVKANVPAASSVESDSKWNSIANWSSSKTDNVTTYFSKVSDSSITANVANAGLVLVFKKSGNTIQSLPVQEQDVYWYYQVSKGSLRINSENNSGQNLNQQSFSYFVITPQQLSTLEASGKTRFDLLDLSYDQAAALLK
jgi:hypothetical protein